MRRRWCWWYISIVLLALGILLARQQRVVPAPRVPPTEVSYFQFALPPAPETFVIQLNNPATISEARRILRGEPGQRIVMGTIIKEAVPYNPPWSYHLDPSSITFVHAATEICDATIQTIEMHLDEVCGSLLPGCVWCPWRSQLLAEIRITEVKIYIPIVRR